MSLKSITLKDILSKKYNTILTRQSVDNFIKYVHYFELRDDHPLLLNSPYLGIYRMVFNPNDRRALFEIFKISESVFKEDIKSVSSYNKDFETISDVFNIFLIWLCHLGLSTKSSSASKKNLEDISLLSLVMLHYKFFSSRLFRIFRYKADEDVMRYTIESLNYRYDILKYETWKNLIYNKCKNYLNSKDSIHYQPLLKFSPDNKIYYIISDIKTKVNSLISSISIEYYKNFELNKSISSFDRVSTVDGEKIIKDSSYVFDTMVNNIWCQISNLKIFINPKYIEAISNIVPEVNFPFLQKFLIYISDKSSSQQTKEKIIQDKVVKTQDGIEFLYYSDIKKLIYKIISFTYKELIQRKVNLNNKLSVLIATKKLYSSGRYTNVEFINIRESIRLHIIESKITRRNQTIVSLIVGFILYILFKAFESV